MKEKRAIRTVFCGEEDEGDSKFILSFPVEKINTWNMKITKMNTISYGSLRNVF